MHYFVIDIVLLIVSGHQSVRVFGFAVLCMFMVATGPLMQQASNTTTGDYWAIVRSDLVEIIYESVLVAVLPMALLEHKPVGILDGVNLGLKHPVSFVGTRRC